MSKSNLTLYNTVLNPAKNWIVEDIEKYLATLEEDTYDVGAVRYIEPKLSQSIVLKGSSAALSGLGYNYAKVTTVEDTGTHTEYYYVQSLEWAGKKSIKVNMLLDTLNTLGVSLIDYMTSQTSIIREHQDRWRKSGTNLLAIVDKYDEGINVAKDTLQHRVLIEDDLDFYCQYSVNATTSNTTDTHPHKCLIATPTNMYWSAGGTTSGSWNIPQDATINIYTLLEGYVQANVGTITSYHIGTDTITENDQTGVLRAIRVNNRRMQLLYYTGDQFPYSFLKKVQVDTSKAATDVIAAFNARRLYYESYETGVWETMFGLDRIPFQTYHEMNAGYYQAQVVRGIDSVDRTYSGLMQINPVLSITKNTDTCKFIEGYNLLLPLTLASTIVSKAAFTTNIKQYTTPSYGDNYVWDNESKLLHSSITDASVRYQDGSIFNIDFSRLNSQLTMTIKQQLSSEATNLVRYYTDVDGYTYGAWSDYYSYAANKYNVPLYSNQWTEYMRNGYNYDVAERARQKTLQGWSLAAGVVSGVTGAASKLIPGISSLKSDVISPVIKAFSSGYNDTIKYYKEIWKESMVHPNYESAQEGLLDFGSQYGKMKYTFGPRDMKRTAAQVAIEDAAKAGLGWLKSSDSVNNALWHTNNTNAVNSIINGVSAISSSNAAYQQNISNKSQARTTINGNTTDYTLAIDNNLDYQVWQPEGYVRSNIAKVFHLTGYSHPVQEKPNVESRAWFNYIQCNPVYDDTYISTINPLWVSDYNDRMAAGVTVFHHVTASEATTQWDFDQAHENWEMSLMI